jgi:hypothetical protein
VDVDPYEAQLEVEAQDRALEQASEQLLQEARALVPAGHGGYRVGVALGLASALSEFALMDVALGPRVGISIATFASAAAILGLLFERVRARAWVQGHPKAAEFLRANVQDALFDDREVLAKVLGVLSEAGRQDAVAQYQQHEARLSQALDAMAGDDGFAGRWPRRRPVTRAEVRLFERRLVRTLLKLPVPRLIEVLGMHLHPDDGWQILREFRQTKADEGEARALARAFARVRDAQGRQTS